jgi:hypothetical protein
MVMINTLRKLRLGRMRSYTPHVGNKLNQLYETNTIFHYRRVPVCLGFG